MEALRSEPCEPAYWRLRQPATPHLLPGEASQSIMVKLSNLRIVYPPYTMFILCYAHSVFVVVPRLELENVEAVLTLEVAKGGRISGLTDYVGCRVLVIVPAKRPARDRKRKQREE